MHFRTVNILNAWHQNFYYDHQSNLKHASPLEYSIWMKNLMNSCTLFSIQIVQLTASGNFEEALALCRMLPLEDSSLRAAKEQSIHIRSTYPLHRNIFCDIIWLLLQLKLVFNHRTKILTRLVRRYLNMRIMYFCILLNSFFKFLQRFVPSSINNSTGIMVKCPLTI